MYTLTDAELDVVTGGVDIDISQTSGGITITNSSISSSSTASNNSTVTATNNGANGSIDVDVSQRARSSSSVVLNTGNSASVRVSGGHHGHG